MRHERIKINTVKEEYNKSCESTINVVKEKYVKCLNNIYMYINKCEIVHATYFNSVNSRFLQLHLCFHGKPFEQLFITLRLFITHGYL